MITFNPLSALSYWKYELTLTLCLVVAGWNYLEARKWKSEHTSRIFNRFQFVRFSQSNTIQSIINKKNDRKPKGKTQLVYIVTISDCGQPLMELTHVANAIDLELIDISVVLVGATTQELRQVVSEFTSRGLGSARVNFVSSKDITIESLGLLRAPYRVLFSTQPLLLLDEDKVEFQVTQTETLVARIKNRSMLLKAISIDQ